MRRTKGRGVFELILTGVVCCGMLMGAAGKAESFILINEFLADPASGPSGDANGDGATSSSQDEFIELLNYSDEDVNLSGWSLSDNLRTRHVFSDSTIINSYGYFVIFGGGDFSAANWQSASTGTLGLNNSGDTITLFNSDLLQIDQIVYGSEGGQNQSLTRFPEGVPGSPFVLHSELAQAQGRLFSVGESIDGQPIAPEIVLPEEPLPEMSESGENPVVPELPVAVYFLVGLAGLHFQRRTVLAKVLAGKTLE
ncbi:MAG: lamin tail domain-containing protein [Candidatus Omnitrophica bacterium]|nr:lamin tail domain-containing protein [Candidatus Omnitrophota bacterium]